MKDANDKKTIDMLKPAPLTNSERQKAYRERRKSDASQRLDVYLDKSVSDQLADIVGAVGGSQKDVLTRLIEKEYNKSKEFIKKEQLVKQIEKQSKEVAITGLNEGAKMGLMNGDKILKIDGKPAVRMENSMINMLLANEITVLRNGKEVSFAPKEDGIAHILGSKTAKLYIQNRFAPVVDSLTEEGPAKQAGLQKGDKIVALNGKTIRFFDEFSDGLAGKKNHPITIDVVRNNEVKTFNLNTDKDGKIGFRPDKQAEAAFNNTVTNQEYSFLPAIGRGFERTVESLTMQIKQFKLMFNKKIKGYKNVGGPIAIVKMMPKEIDWVAFWSFTAMFSAWLAFLNILPIPGLDGGHALFTTWELITGKPVPQKVLENAQMIGVIFLMGLMLLIFGSDIYKFIISPFLK